MAKDKKSSKESAQEQKAPVQARHSAKERPRLPFRGFDKEVAPALLKRTGNCKTRWRFRACTRSWSTWVWAKATQNAKVLDPAVNELGQINRAEGRWSRAAKKVDCGRSRFARDSPSGAMVYAARRSYVRIFSTAW